MSNKYLLSSLIFIVCIQKIFNKIYIRGPKELADKFKNNEIQGSVSKFGNIPYGYNIVGSLYYTNKTIDSTTVSLGCNDTTLSVKINKSIDIDESPIILLDRGECSFVKKVINAEKIGAQAVLVINSNFEDVSELIMADDGNGKYVTIPAELINKSDGLILKNYMKENPGQEISIEIDFKLVIF